MSQPKDEWDVDFIKAALARLYKDDNHLIAQGKERAAAARFACHLRDVLKETGFLSKFPPIRIDTEYGREGNHPKYNVEGAQVIPDIIVHVPGEKGPNVAAIEIKGGWNPEDKANDEKKLQGYKARQQYAFAYFIRLNTNSGNVTSI